MLQRIFTNRQLSLFFQTAIFINIIGLLSDIIVYRYFPHCTSMKFINQNLSNLSIIMVCAVVISTIMIGIYNKYETLIKQYKLLSFTIMIIISTFLFWLLNIDNTIQEKTIIFFSNVSRFDHSNKILYIVIALVGALLFNFYSNFKNPEKINSRSVQTMIYSIIRLVMKEYALIFLTLFTMVNIKQLQYLQSNILNYTQSSIFADLTFLEIIIPAGWVIIIAYYIFDRFFRKKE